MRLIEQKIPKKYKILHEFVIAKAAVMRRHKEPPILTLEDLKRYESDECLCTCIISILCRSLLLNPVKELIPIDNTELYYGLEYLKDKGTLTICYASLE